MVKLHNNSYQVLKDEAERSKTSFLNGLEKIDSTKKPRVAKMLQSIRAQNEMSELLGDYLIELIEETAKCDKIAEEEGKNLREREAMGIVVSVISTIITIASLAVVGGKRVCFSRAFHCCLILS